MTNKPVASNPLDLLAAKVAASSMPAARHPIDCGYFDITIARDGTWYYRGSPIGRPALVRLFSTVLHRAADGSYWLQTPAERGRITVEDAPFIAVELTRHGAGRQQELIFRTNIDETVAVNEEHPLRVVNNPATAAPNPYVLVRDGLEARLNRPVFYELVELGQEERVGDTTLFGVWSKGAFFPIGPLDPAS